MPPAQTKPLFLFGVFLSMVNADRVKRKLPSLLVDGSTTKKKSWQQWITDYDFTYDKALERKMNKKNLSLNSFSLVGRLKKQVNITLKERKKLEKHSHDLFTLDFFVVLGENI